VILFPQKAKSVEFSLAKLISPQSSQCFFGENDKICRGEKKRKHYHIACFELVPKSLNLKQLVDAIQFCILNFV
jgi:hypothetical protein